MIESDFLEKIIQQVLTQAEEIKEETQKHYGENSVDIVHKEGEITVSLKEDKNIYRELGTRHQPPTPMFYRAYQNRRQKLLRNIADTAKENIRLED